jgi:hypothetical protein
VAYRRIIIKDLNISATGKASWLDDPEVLSPIHLSLSKFVDQTSEQGLAEFVNIGPVRMLPLFFIFKGLIFTKMFTDMFEHFFIPFLAVDKFDVALWVSAPQDEGMLLLSDVHPGEHTIILLLYYVVGIFKGQFTLNQVTNYH